MNVAISLPEALRSALEDGVESVDVRRWALEALVLEALREGRITRREAGMTLGLGFHEREGFLRSRGVTYDLSDKELEQERRAVLRTLKT